MGEMPETVTVHCPACGQPVQVPVQVTDVKREANMTNKTDALVVQASGVEPHYCRPSNQQGKVTGL